MIRMFPNRLYQTVCDEGYPSYFIVRHHKKEMRYVLALIDYENNAIAMDFMFDIHIHPTIPQMVRILQELDYDVTYIKDITSVYGSSKVIKAMHEMSDRFNKNGLLTTIKRVDI